MVFEKESLRVENRWILAKEECLHLNKLDVVVLRLLWGKLWLSSCSWFILLIRFLTTLRCSRLTFLCWTVCISRSRRLWHDRRWWAAGSGLTTSWWHCQTLAISHIIRLCIRLVLFTRWKWLLVAHIWSVIVVCIDTQWMCLLTSSFVVIFRRWLANSYKLSLILILRPIDDLPSRWKHPTLHLIILAHLSSSTPIWMHLIVGFLYFITLLTFVDTAHSLAPSTEETFHAVEIHYSLHSLRTLLLLFLLDLVHLVLLIGLLNTYIVVTKPALLLLLWIRTLDLRLKCVIDALSLRQWMVHALRTANLIHSHIWTHWHALMNLPTSWW